VALGLAYLFPTLSSGGASIACPLLPVPHPPHRTGHADLPHPALGQDVHALTAAGLGSEARLSQVELESALSTQS
jgi:hypothetical protein